jgi:DNA-binding winged helix-turn-helix (wHTH) protein
MHASSIVTFRDYELDNARFELRHRAVPLDVQPKVLRLLLYLVAQRERAIPTDELLKVLWPDETVSRASVKRAVRGARVALGCEGEAEGGIRTIRRYGYQFVWPVTQDLRSDRARVSAVTAPLGENAARCLAP